MPKEQRNQAKLVFKEWLKGMGIPNALLKKLYPKYYTGEGKKNEVNNKS